MRDGTPTAGWSGGDPDDLTAWSLVRAYHLVGQIFYRTLAPHGLTPQQFGVLIALVDRPGTSQAALAREVLTTPQALGEMLQGMAERGLVERTAPAGRGHAASVELATEGRGLLDVVTPLVLDAVRPEALGLDDDGSATLNDLLLRVVARLRGA